MSGGSTLSASDRKLLNTALERGRAFEARFVLESETPFREALAACATGDSPLVVKLAELARKVSFDQGPKHLMALLVPIERLSGRAARDEEFLFEERDSTPDTDLATKRKSNLVDTRARAVLCENIRSAFNVGAIFRTAEAFSATEIQLCGYTPDPQKTAMGADALVSSRRFERASDAITSAKADGFKVVALENAPGATALEDFRWPEKTLLVLGNERFGIDSETLAHCDHVVRISATGLKNSINVGIAFGVAASRWFESPQTPLAPENPMQARVDLSRKISPIGFLRGGFANTQVTPRQGAYRPSNIQQENSDHMTDASSRSTSASIELEARFEGRPSNFEQALQDLEGFERAWIVFGFHDSQGWNPQVRPPRGDGAKRGLFATRSPHRPNGLGISCIRISKVDSAKRRIEVSEHDLLEGTPIFDIKPYIPGADAFPHAKSGWLDAIEESAFKIVESETAKSCLDWLEANGEIRLRPFIDEQLRYQPLDHTRKRVFPTEAVNTPSSPDHYTIAFRTWRIDFFTNTNTNTIEAKTIELLLVRSGYSESEIESEDDPYCDKKLHRAYRDRK